MAIVKLSLEDFYDEDYYLIAIHSGLEDYKLAFLLNQHLLTTFEKNEYDISIFQNNLESTFSRFIFDDQAHDLFWNLISNTCIVSQKNSEGMFSETSYSFNLLPEFKNVDYFLKIENIDVHFNLNDLIEKISAISQVTLCYHIDTENIKSIKNLIF